jgi:glycosyltransferase involved in cell wall biosynthesis
LHDFFINVYRDRDDYKGYLTQMEHYYGSSGRKFAETIWEGTFPPGYGVADYPLTRLALENALAVLVHTREAFDALRQENRRPAAFAPLPYAGASVWTEKEKDKFPYRLILFGHIGYNRRCEAVLQALATFPDNECFRLDIYGQVWNIPDLYSRISDLDLEGKVIIHGFVSDAELQSALASAHLALNLRYPTMGESSFSQLQIWEHALPSLVTPVGWYAELSRDTVAFVRPDQEVSDIKEHLKAFLDDPKKFAQMGRNGRRQLEEQHSPTRYVQVLKDLVHQARNFEAIATAHSLAERVGSETSLWLDSDASAEVFRGVAKQILSICSNRS